MPPKITPKFEITTRGPDLPASPESLPPSIVAPDVSGMDLFLANARIERLTGPGSFIPVGSMTVFAGSSLAEANLARLMDVGPGQQSVILRSIEAGLDQGPEGAMKARELLPKLMPYVSTYSERHALANRLKERMGGGRDADIVEILGQIVPNLDPAEGLAVAHFIEKSLVSDEILLRTSRSAVVWAAEGLEGPLQGRFFDRLASHLGPENVSKDGLWSSVLSAVAERLDATQRPHAAETLLGLIKSRDASVRRDAYEVLTRLAPGLTYESVTPQMAKQIADFMKADPALLGMPDEGAVLEKIVGHLTQETKMDLLKLTLKRSPLNSVAAEILAPLAETLPIAILKVSAVQARKQELGVDLMIIVMFRESGGSFRNPEGWTEFLKGSH